MDRKDTAETAAQLAEEVAGLRRRLAELEEDERRYGAGLEREVSRRERAEAALCAIEEKSRAILSSIEDGYYEVDFRGDFTLANEAIARILGYEMDELIGMNYRQYYVHAENIKTAFDAYNRVYQTGVPSRGVDWVVTRKDGATRIVEVSISLVHDGAGRPVGFRGICRDVTERRKTEEALRFQATLLNQIGDLVTATDLDGRITYVNAASCHALGRTPEQLIGQSVESFGDDPAQGAMQRDIIEITRNAGAWRGEVVNFASDGREVILESATWMVRDTHGKPVGLCGVSRDITERKRAEEEREKLQAQLQQAQKLESLGVLAGGIAHDFNNLLMGILGHASLGMLDLEPDSPVRENLAEIETGARRAADLCRQLLAYSGKGRFVIQAVDLSALVKEMGNLLKVSISKKASVHYDLAPDLPAIEADATQVRQVIMNLITNASDALESKEGRIAIRTGLARRHDAAPRDTGLVGELTPGDYVYVEVSDTGCGMSEATRQRMFDPFYTTKFAGRGLGLAAVLGIVRGHGGALDVRSEEGRGTTFRAFFPCSERRAQPLTGWDACANDWRGSGTALVADDEDTVRRLAQRMLERLGFSVYAARDGREAVDLFRRHRDEIRLVLLDMAMPRMDGEEAFLAIRRLHGDVPVVLSSGFDAQDAAARLRDKGLAGFLQKPYQFSALAEMLRRVLGE
ncbi:MAG: PAS domain S-box protein [Candidatus Hydrogenedentes bacterium]|nr:PAS domain S-box protein [Candidatus Hydrogenedentota bacterium]